ncbi:MAG: hypothetical protein Q9180_008104 [Flavoplaca navasiana]
MFTTADLALIRNNLALSTWLLIGAAIQSLIFAILPPRVAALPSICILTLVLAKNLLITGGYLKNPYLAAVYKGKATATLQEGEDGDGRIAIFILGATSNHPLGILAPGFNDILSNLQSMWAEAEADTTKSGLLGKSTSLLPLPTTPTSSSPTILNISYWQSLSHLHAFAQSPAHRSGWEWWGTRARKRYPHLGIMHETYEAAKGRWENVYDGFGPVGMGALTRKVVMDGGEERVESRLVPAREGRLRTMKGRLGVGDE